MPPTNHRKHKNHHIYKYLNNALPHKHIDARVTTSLATGPYQNLRIHKVNCIKCTKPKTNRTKNQQEIRKIKLKYVTQIEISRQR